jgi:AGCS family alanine or glycine:cation symporter
MVFCLLIVVGAVSELEIVWTFADIMNGLMALPNLVGLLGLSGIVVEETRRYFAPAAAETERRAAGR